MSDPASCFETGSATHPGKVRKQNEDNLFVQPEIGIWAVADGMGGHLDGALASRRILATVEEIVPAAVVRSRPDRTVVPGFRVSAVCEVPLGAYPAYVEGFYGRDDAAYADWDKLARSAERLDAWLEAEVRGVASFADYVVRLDPARLAELKAARGRDLRSAA